MGLCASKDSDVTKPQEKQSQQPEDAQVAPVLSKQMLSKHNGQHDSEQNVQIIKRQSTDSSAETDVYSSVKAEKGELLTMSQKKNLVTANNKGASRTSMMLVHDTDATDKMKLWDIYEYVNANDGKYLGRGATATVRLIQDKSTKKKYALKTVRLSKVLSPSKRRSFRREVDLIRALDHPNIIKITETFTDEKGDFHLVMPYCDGGNYSII